MAEFYILLLQNLSLFVGLVLTSIAVLYFIFRKRFFSIFDPFFYFLILTESFCIADVIFMMIYDLIEYRHFVQYICSELALFCGILLIRPRINSVSNEMALKPNFEVLRVLFYLCLFLFVAFNFYVYATRGIPLFLDNRMSVYQEGTGLGFISRMLDVLLIVIFYYLLEIHRLYGWSWREWSYLALVAFIQLLSGAKSSILTLVFIAALFVFISGAASEGNTRLMLLIKRIFLLALGGFLLVAQVQISDVEIGGYNLSLPEQAAMRFVNNGDAFLYAYPSNAVDALDGRGPIFAVLREYVAFFRLASPEQIQMHLGLQLTREFIASDSINQTNAKHNLFGIMNFGSLGGIIFSLLIGLVVGIVREVIFKNRGSSWISGISYIILNLGFLSVANDFDNSSRAVLNVFFVFYHFLYHLDNL